MLVLNLLLLQMKEEIHVTTIRNEYTGGMN